MPALGRGGHWRHRSRQVHRVLRSSHDLVFADHQGLPLNPDGVSQRFERLVVRSGLPPVRLHDLRHGAATIGLSAGVSMKTISELLGHSTVSFTADRYTSVTDEVGFAAAESVAAIVPPKQVQYPSSPVRGLCVRPVPALARIGQSPEPRRGHRRRSGVVGRWGGWGSNPGPTDYESPSGGFMEVSERTYAQVRALFDR